MSTRTFITGGTGLVGRHLVDRLLARGGTVFVLARADREDLATRWQAVADVFGGTLELVRGDVTAPGLGLVDGAVNPCTLDHVFHVAGYYDLTGDAARMRAVNVEGTKNVLAWLGDGFGGVLHHVSSVAVAGDKEGRFGEDDLERGQRFPTEYHRTKHESEALVRATEGIRWRVYRPSAVVGDSTTGEMDRVDGPYFLFRAIHEIRRVLPPWVTLPGMKAGRVNMVPVDHVADAIDAIAHREGFDGRGFHVVDPSPPPFRETFNLIADAAGAPRMARFRLGKIAESIPGLGNVVGQLGSLKFMRRQMAEDLGVPAVVAEVGRASAEYDTTNLAAALEGSGIACPPQEAYVERLWDHYLRNLAPDRDEAKRKQALFGGKVAFVTGGSSGIGEALAKQLAEAGARVVICARREEELKRVASEIEAAGGAVAWVVADLSKADECDRAVSEAVAEVGPIDVLVNNAGKSIRRSLAESLERFHDLERVMQINFFGPARLIRAVLPSMRERGGGTIVNVLSAGAHMPSPRFGAYTASKAALSQLGDALAAEHLHEDVRVVNAYLPWVRTPMMDATGKYEDTRAMTPERAAKLVLDGIADRKQHVGSMETRRRHALSRLHPSGMARILNLVYRLYPDDPKAHPELELDRMILQRFVKTRLI